MRACATIASLQAGIAADPRPPAAYEQLGAILTEQGELGAAEANYRRLIEAQPSAGAHQKLAQVLIRLGRIEEAEKEMARARAMGARWRPGPLPRRSSSPAA